MKCKMYLFVAILENGRNLEFSIGQSYRMKLINIEMSQAKFGDCITICTIHLKIHTLCSTISVTTTPRQMLQHAPMSSRSRNL